VVAVLKQQQTLALSNMLQYTAVRLLLMCHVKPVGGKPLCVFVLGKEAPSAHPADPGGQHLLGLPHSITVTCLPARRLGNR
jgi:hypothetical protein